MDENNHNNSAAGAARGASGGRPRTAAGTSSTRLVALYALLVGGFVVVRFASTQQGGDTSANSPSVGGDHQRWLRSQHDALPAGADVVRFPRPPGLDRINSAYFAQALPPPTACDAGEGAPGVTLATQSGLERAMRAVEICSRWDGPISFVLYIPFQRAADFFSGDTSKLSAASVTAHAETLCPKLRLVFATPDDEALDAAEYPTNVLRNLAIQRVRTSHFLLVDVDFNPSPGLHASLVDATLGKGPTWEARGPAVLVVPAFDLAPNCVGDPECAFAHTLLTEHDLAACVAQGFCEEFLFTAQPLAQSSSRPLQLFEGYTATEGAGATDSKGWRELRCIESNRYEPYVVARKCQVPRFLEALLGYGKNKIAWYEHLRAAGFRFHVATRGFLLHMPHMPSESMMSSDEYRQVVARIYQRFRAWLADTFPADVAQTGWCDAANDGLEETQARARARAEHAKVLDLVTPSDARFKVWLSGRECHAAASDEVAQPRWGDADTLHKCREACWEERACRLVAFDRFNNKCRLLRACVEQPGEHVSFDIVLRKQRSAL